MKYIGYIIIFIIRVLFGSVIIGWALSTLWLWFVVPEFGVPEISIPTAVGLASIAGLFSHVKYDFNEDAGKDFTAIMSKQLFVLSIKALVAVSVGWVALGFV